MLLDTCILLWLTSERHKISNRAIREMESHAASLCVSAISVFEIGILVRKGRVDPGKPLSEWVSQVIKEYRLEILPITWPIAALSTSLADVHRDPADRLIVATAHAHRLPIVTPDPKIAAYPDVKVVW